MTELAGAGIITAFDFERDTVPAYKRPGFEVNQHGVFYRNFEEIRTRVCDFVEVLAIVSNSEATRWGKLISFINARNQQKHLVVPMRLLISTPRYLSAELSLRGLRVNSSMRCMRLLREYLNGEQPRKNLVLEGNIPRSRAIFVKLREEKLEIEKPPNGTAASDYGDHHVVARLKSFLEKYRNFFQDLSDRHSSGQKIGYRKRVGNAIFYYIPPKYFKREVASSDPEMEILAKEGLLIPNDKGHYCSVTELAGWKERAYVVKTDR
ncbi:MAG: DUF927 domain-containing protein [Holosporaceae bacterium]|jgi:hypothetical protein|nr:DUF927 domain-containing protein [Holosporaceae bacterium]